MALAPAQRQLQRPQPRRPRLLLPSRRSGVAASAAHEPAREPSSQQPPEAQHAAAVHGNGSSSGSGGDGSGPGHTAAPHADELAAAAAAGPAAFAAAVRRLTERGSGATEAHVVVAWTVARRTPGLRTGRRGRRGRHGEGGPDADALAALEGLTRQHLVALRPDQLGYVARCYVLAGGASRPLLAALQAEAAGWAADDYSAAGLAELAWALASTGEPLTPACRDLIRSALGCDAGVAPGGSQASGNSQPEQPVPSVQVGGGGEAVAAASAAPPPPAHQHLQHDWAAWFEGTPASRIALLLWAAARLECRPAPACLEAAVAALRHGRGLASLHTKVRRAERRRAQGAACGGVVAGTCGAPGTCRPVVPPPSTSPPTAASRS